MLKVVDLFCGPGGMGEGLRQAGFQTVYALDKVKAAADTYSRNHPGALVECLDVTGFDPEKLPEFDILIGGPPCIEFSNSKGNRGNILEGLRLVQEFLRVVYERKPRYWIMENVPRIVLHLPEEIPLTWIGVEKRGSLHIPTRREFNCADFGVPQARKRFLMGNFPPPEQTHAASPLKRDLFTNGIQMERWKTLGDIMEHLGSPLRTPRQQYVDPNYGFTVEGCELTDHRHAVLLNEREVRQIRRAKVEHPFMGRMAFPDELDRPARTVVATQLGRETLVIGERQGHQEVYRRASVRECAALQTFPVTYQFFGGNLGARYRLVGDAVPPRLTYLIGCEIRQEMGLPPKSPDVVHQPTQLAPPVEARPSRAPKFRFDRRFGELVPGKEIRGCRVELENWFDDFPEQGSAPICWNARLYLGEGKATIRSKTYSIIEALHLLGQDARKDKVLREKIRELLSRCEQEFLGKLSDASTLQAIWTGREAGGSGPERIVDTLTSIINSVFPPVVWSDRFVKTQSGDRFLPARGLRVRIVAGLVGTAYCATIINGAAASGVREKGGSRGGVVRSANAGTLAPHDVLLAEALKSSSGRDEPALQLA
jgi:DNA (cytosine-5)-methyltransferase 1